MMRIRGLTIGLTVAAMGFLAIESARSATREAAAGATIEPWQGDPDVSDEREPRGGPLLDEPPRDERDPDAKERDRRLRDERREAKRRRASRRWRPGGKDDGFPGRPLPVPPEKLGPVMEVIRMKLPEFHERLEMFRRESPRRFEHTMHKVLPVVREYMALHERNPEVAETIIEEFRIEERLRELGRWFKMARSRPEERAEIGEEIERLVNEQIELRFRRQAFRLDEFERRLRQQAERLEQQRAQFQEEMERRDELVAHRVEEVKRGSFRDGLRPRGPRPRGRDGAFEERPPRGPRGEGRRLRPWLDDDEDHPRLDRDERRRSRPRRDKEPGGSA